MRFEFNKSYGYFNIIAENKKENELVERVRKDLAGVWGNENYKLTPLKCTCPKGQYTLSHLEFKVVNEDGKERADFFNIRSGGFKR